MTSGPSGASYAMSLPVAIPAAPVTLARTGAAVQSLALGALALLAGGVLLRVGASRRTRMAD